MPVLSTLSSAYAALGARWASLASATLGFFAPYVGDEMAKCLTHTLWAQLAFHSFFWPGFLLFRYIDRNDLLPQWKLHPGKWEPAALNDRVWKGLTTPPPPSWRGVARMALAYFMFFSFGRQSITGFPSFKTLVFNQAAAYMINDLLFYVQHRALHEVPSFYKKYHKVHHEFKVTNIGATSWNNWEESFGIMVCGNLSALAMRMTLFEYMVWIVFGTFYDAHVHLGYRIPFNPLNWVSPPEWHDFHHYKNLGNYATGTPIWDVVFGTDKHYRLWQAKQAAAKAKGVEGDDGPTRADPFEEGFKEDA